MADLPLPPGTKTIVVDDPWTPFDGVTAAEIEAEQKWWRDVKRYLAVKGYYDVVVPSVVEFVEPAYEPLCPPAGPDQGESGLIRIDLDSDVVVGFGREDESRVCRPPEFGRQTRDGTVRVRMTAAQFREVVAGRPFVVGEGGRAELIDEPTVVEGTGSENL